MTSYVQHHAHELVEAANDPDTLVCAVSGCGYLKDNSMPSNIDNKHRKEHSAGKRKDP